MDREELIRKICRYLEAQDNKTLAFTATNLLGEIVDYDVNMDKFDFEQD
jgi:hypothetical protein